jgi:uncharacterized membrane protein YqhA
MSDRPVVRRDPQNSKSEPASPAPFAETVGHTRFIVLIGVGAVLMVAASLFILGTATALSVVYRAFHSALAGNIASTDLTVEFLEIVSVFLKAVVFYIVGVGFYSLFIAPLNLPAALGVETLNDLESKIVSVVIVIMAVTFLEHFIVWQNAFDILQFGTAMSLVIAALVLFQFHSQKAKEEAMRNTPAVEEDAHRQLFAEGEERRNLNYSTTGEYSGQRTANHARGADDRST